MYNLCQYIIRHRTSGNIEKRATVVVEGTYLMGQRW